MGGSRLGLLLDHLARLPDEALETLSGTSLGKSAPYVVAEVKRRRKARIAAFRALPAYPGSALRVRAYWDRTDREWGGAPPVEPLPYRAPTLLLQRAPDVVRLGRLRMTRALAIQMLSLLA